MGRQHHVRRQKSRDEQIAFLKAHGETDESIAALLAHSQVDQSQAADRAARVGPEPAPKAKAIYRIRNWSEYNQSLVQRGNITIWFDLGNPPQAAALERVRLGGLVVGFSQNIADSERMCSTASNVGLRAAQLSPSGDAPEQQEMLPVAAPNSCVAENISGVPRTGATRPFGDTARTEPFGVNVAGCRMRCLSSREA